jgi:hypothetical protein
MQLKAVHRQDDPLIMMMQEICSLVVHLLIPLQFHEEKKKKNNRCIAFSLNFFLTHLLLFFWHSYKTNGKVEATVQQ